MHYIICFQQNFIQSITFPDSMSRHNSVTNMLKRFFSREDKPETKEQNELNNLISSNEYVPKTPPAKKITDEVIEEVSNNSFHSTPRKKIL